MFSEELGADQSNTPEITVAARVVKQIQMPEVILKETRVVQGSGAKGSFVELVGL